MLATLLACTSALIVAPNSAEASDCNNVVFDRTDAELHVRTMVVEDSNRQRMLVLTSDNDTSLPCKPRWWLDHNPQGAIQCAPAPAHGGPSTGNSCDLTQCKADASDVQLGYVRTMLASTIFVPQPHTMSAICIELGCRSRITRQRVGSLLAAPTVQWAPRSRVQRMLVIGLGSSTMALWVRQQLPDTELHIAELVPGVAAAAPCFGLDTKNGKDNRLHMHVGDGRSVLENSVGKFDVILVDAFDKDASLPPCFRTKEFFAAARQKLTPGGAISFNLFSDGDSKIRIVKALSGSFDASHIWVGDAPGAVGIQEVITAFTPGHPSTHSGSDTKAPSTGRARHWWDSAHYRQLKFEALPKDDRAFEDLTECPHHHG